jgi:UDP-N-acetylmuramyl pentapeptide synthase
MEHQDPIDTIDELAASNQRRFGGTAIAVAGSVGKCTTQRMIHTVLGSKLHGAALSGLCRPTIVAIARGNDATYAGVAGHQAIASAEAELLDGLDADGKAILGDDSSLREIAHRSRAAVTWVGTGRDCDLRATDVRSGHGRLEFRVDGRWFGVPVWGRHNLTSALIAIAVGRMFGIADREIAVALESFEPLPKRCEVIRAGGVTIIDDTCGSNPASARAALAVLREFDAGGRRVAVCGDMDELDTRSIAAHRKLGKQAYYIGKAEILFACGQYAATVAAGARSAGIPHDWAVAAGGVEEVLPRVAQTVQPGDVVLVKGSRSLQLDRVVQALSKADEPYQVFSGRFTIDNECRAFAPAMPISRHNLQTEPLVAPLSPSNLREFGDTLPSLGRSNIPRNAATGSAAPAGASRRSL